MGNQDKKKVQKYMAIYMSIGMCFGVSGGLIFGMIFRITGLLGCALGYQSECVLAWQ